MATHQTIGASHRSWRLMGLDGAIAWIVAPLMLSQAALLAWMVVVRPSPYGLIAAGAVAVAWLWTFAVAVPCHDTLRAVGLDRSVVARLVAANCVRNAAWTQAFLLLLFA
jgi:hypothetical protein